jgi:acyl dehydratase
MRIKVGDEFSRDRHVTAEVIRRFADVSGDRNPIHLDAEFARTTKFGRPIAHGMLSGAFISAILASGPAGLAGVYLSQTMNFTAPVFEGDTVTATARVMNIREDKNIVTLKTICTNQNGETVVSGEAVIMLLEV